MLIELRAALRQLHCDTQLFLGRRVVSKHGVHDATESCEEQVSLELNL